MDSYEEMLVQAIKEEDLKCVQYCLSKGANPNRVCPSGRTPMGLAAQQGNLKILQELAEKHQAALLDKNSSSNLSEQRKSLHLDFAINKPQNRNVGYFVVCKDLDEGEFGEGPTPDGMEALEWDMEVTDDNSEEDCLSSTPPDARIYKWYADVLNRTAIVLESPENDIARFDGYGLNVLHYAVRYGHCDIVEYLIDNFKEITVNQSSADMFSPMHIAAQNGDTEMVKLLLRKGANMQFINRQRHTPLHLASQKGYLDVINILIENGANVNVYDMEDCPPLSCAIMCGHEEAAKLLITKGSRLNHEEGCGYTVLHRAVWNNMTSLVKALLDAGAKIIQSHCLLHITIRNNNLEMMKMLHKHGAILNIKDEHGKTPLMLACIYKNFQIAKYLLKNGAPANVKNELTGLTALHICVDSIRDFNVFQSFLELLLAHNADIDADSYMGSVLFYSIIVGNLKASCALVKHGADVNQIERKSMVDNLSLAKKHGTAELVKLIVLAGFKFSNVMCGIKYLKYQNDDPVYDFIEHYNTTPMDLRGLCRIRIRNLIKKNLIRRIYRLPLPTMLLQYLALEEL